MRRLTPAELVIDRIIAEFHENLRAARFSAEGPTASLDTDKVSRGKSEGGAPRGGPSMEDECLAIYADANHAVRRLLKRPWIAQDGEHDRAAVEVSFQANIDHALSPEAGALYEDANRAARQLLERAKRRRKTEETIEQKKYWILYHSQGKRPEELAEQYGVTPGFVRELRTKQRQYSETGKPGSPGRGRPRQVRRDAA